MNRKLQIFVSSTYLDLREERQAAVQAILDAGHIPAGMELFSAGDEEQLEVIYRWIDESDALLLILGERYGSTEPKSGKSYIQLEYEYASRQGKRFFALVLDESWIEEKYRLLGGNATDEYRKEHKEFKTLVLSRMSALVSDLKDVHIQVNKTLREFDRDPKLVGWLRASEAAGMKRLIEELQISLEELRARSHDAEAPTISNLQRRFDQYIKDLTAIGINFMIRKNDARGGSPLRYRLEGNALGFLWKFKETLLLGVVSHVYSEDPAEREFVRAIMPLLNIWGLTRLSPEDSRWFILTDTGKLFVQYVANNPPSNDDWVEAELSPE